MEIMRLCKNSGFTLWEMMTVIGIIAVLSTIAVPNFLGWIPKYRLSSAARDLLSALQYARLAAVKYNVDVQVVFFPDQNHYRIFTDYNGDKNQDADEPTIKSATMPAGVYLMETNFKGDIFKFNGRGLAAGSGGTISIANHCNDLTKIRVNRTGNSRILKKGKK
jgi:type IV fimbrial biogenesis protein FimT